MIPNTESAKIRQIVLLKIAGPVLVIFFLYIATAFAVWGFETAQGRNFEQALEDAGMSREEYVLNGKECDSCPREPNIERPDDALWWSTVTLGTIGMVIIIQFRLEEDWLQECSS